MNRPPQVPVAVRLNKEEIGHLDQIIQRLMQRNPDWHPTRSDAIRVLISTSVNTPSLVLNGDFANPPPS